MTTRILLVTAALASLCCGCGRDEEPAPAADKFDKPYSRMDDPEYRKVLQERVDGRKEIMREQAALMQELKAVQAKDPASPRVKELQEKLRELAERHLRQRQETQRIVTERIRREVKAIDGRRQREGAGAEAAK